MSNLLLSKDHSEMVDISGNLHISFHDLTTDKDHWYL